MKVGDDDTVDVQLLQFSLEAAQAECSDRSIKAASSTQSCADWGPARVNAAMLVGLNRVRWAPQHHESINDCLDGAASVIRMSTHPLLILQVLNIVRLRAASDQATKQPSRQATRAPQRTTIGKPNITLMRGFVHRANG